MFQRSAVFFWKHSKSILSVAQCVALGERRNGLAMFPKKTAEVYKMINVWKMGEKMGKNQFSVEIFVCKFENFLKNCQLFMDFLNFLKISSLKNAKFLISPL